MVFLREHIGILGYLEGYPPKLQQQLVLGNEVTKARMHLKVYYYFYNQNKDLKVT